MALLLDVDSYNRLWYVSLFQSYSTRLGGVMNGLLFSVCIQQYLVSILLAFDVLTNSVKAIIHHENNNFNIILNQYKFVDLFGPEIRMSDPEIPQMHTIKCIYEILLQLF